MSRLEKLGRGFHPASMNRGRIDAPELASSSSAVPLICRMVVLASSHSILLTIILYIPTLTLQYRYLTISKQAYLDFTLYVPWIPKPSNPGDQTTIYGYLLPYLLSCLK